MAALQDENQKDSYVFNRDHLSSIRCSASLHPLMLLATTTNAQPQRLNYQHFWMQQLCGYLLHPLIPVQSSHLRVADIGTGTGIYPTSLAASIPPTTRIDGFDISSAQYPHREWLSKNVYLYEQDAFKPFPAEFVGVYDVVHVRFFSTLVKPGNLRGLLENLKSLLKSGGHLQWLDCDATSSRVATTSPSAPSSATEKMAALLRKPSTEADYSWIPTLPETITDLGLSVLAHETLPMQDSVRPLWAQSNLLGLEEYASKIGGEAAAKTRELVEEFKAEIARGTSIDVDYFCVVAVKEKPL